MKYESGKTRIRIALALTSLALAGCLEIMGDETQDEANNTEPDIVSNNRAPVISGNPPPAIRVGDSYSFIPDASDPDGDALTFSVQNKPNWLAFDRSTGALTGSATLGSEGIYGDISISVSDGIDSVSLPAFSVEITQIALGSTTLTWTPPTENSDGTPLMDLAAYKIYYGTSSGIYTNSIRIDNPGIASYVVENLIPNTYYFVATSINLSGIESPYSNEATKLVTSM